MPSPEDLAERERIRAALIELVAERGFLQVDEGLLAARARVGVTAIPRLFGSLRGCFSEVWHQIDRELAEALQAGFDEKPGFWNERLRRGLEALLVDLDENPGRARLYLLDAPRVSDALIARREMTQARLAEIIDRGREEMQAPRDIPDLVAEAVAGAIWYRLEGRLRAGLTGSLRAELPLITYFAVLPFCGMEVAKSELDRKSPPN